MKRFGRLNLPTYRLVAADSRSPRDGRIIEALGYYLPLMPREQEQLKLNAERISYWLSVGAQPSEVLHAGDHPDDEHDQALGYRNAGSQEAGARQEQGEAEDLGATKEEGAAQAEAEACG